MKILICIIYIFLISCSGKSNSSMDLLSKAFIDWYKYNHNYKNPETDNSVYLYKNIFNEIEFNEYLKDLNKFELELSQINYTKLKIQRQDLKE